MVTMEYLTVQEALQLVLAGVSVLPAQSTPLLESLGRVLAVDVVARDNLPPFANSAMDGYAVRAADVAGAAGAAPVFLDVVADIPAGSVSDVTVTPGAAARIMTGAPLPPGADAVIPVEDTDEPWRDAVRPLPAQIGIKRAVNTGDYVRQAGEELRVGQVVVRAGQRIRPQEIGLMASLGYSQISAVRPPRVGILATGDELIPIAAALQPGKIRNSNSYVQAAQVQRLGAQPVMLGVAGDSETAVRHRLQEGVAAGVDLFISSAGVSVGVYDVVKAVLDAYGDVRFWRVRMRPGKPLAYGKFAGIPYLGLPGNPVSAMVSFERFARPAILKMAGHQQLQPPCVQATLLEEIHSDGRESYLRAVVTRSGDSYQAATTGSQESHRMTSLVRANALLIVPEGVKYVAVGEQLPAMMIDWPETVF